MRNGHYIIHGSDRNLLRSSEYVRTCAPSEYSDQPQSDQSSLCALWIAKDGKNLLRTMKTLIKLRGCVMHICQKMRVLTLRFIYPIASNDSKSSAGVLII